ncbi:MAG TPA: cysteine--tRNA ligase [Candidatus Saccharimonadales bacterium]|nr:cysteine--tRNA ligase [Candidatus Saccharimonadales bacterium]
MQLYNQRERQVTEFTSHQANAATIYSCGPTVYDHAHIGNLSSYVFADILRRALQLAGYHTTHAMNYTDVDDKTIRRSKESYPQDEPHAALAKLTDHYIELFLSDMQQVGNDTAALTFLRATDTIEEMKQHVSDLHTAGFAYVADDGVYFSIDAYQKSGKTYGQLLELTISNTSEARIQNDEYDKESVHDFALWKTQKDGEPAWEFTLDGQDLTGRPGWHIECSVMSRKALGQPFDIHTGGVDLIFPHHENEIAQSTALEANPIMAQFFTHNDHILVDGKKMAKSAKNFYTLTDIVDKGYDPLAFRMMMLQSHYRSQMNFTWESLDAAQNRLKNLRAFADLRFQPIVGDSETAPLDFIEYQQQMQSALLNDLRTPQVLEILSGLADARSNAITTAEQADFEATLRFVDDALGLKLLESSDITQAQKELLAARQKARQEKDWATSDQLRDELVKQKIGIRDTDHGAIWFRL